MDLANTNSLTDVIELQDGSELDRILDEVRKNGEKPGWRSLKFDPITGKLLEASDSSTVPSSDAGKLLTFLPSGFLSAMQLPKKWNKLRCSE